MMENTEKVQSFRVIIAGGRDFDDEDLLQDSMWQLYGDSDYGYACSYLSDYVIVSGGARGADKLGEQWAKDYSFPVERYPAQWELYGKQAGHIRNHQMAEVSNVLVAFWDGQSKGTENMISTALKKGLEVHVYRYNSI